MSNDMIETIFQKTARKYGIFGFYGVQGQDIWGQVGPKFHICNLSVWRSFDIFAYIIEITLQKLERKYEIFEFHGVQG